MLSPVNEGMTRAEKNSGIALASIFSLRMLGLFLIFPVFSVYAGTLPGGDNMTLVGIALGAYGLTQAIFQIPFGMASDRFGRKPVIIFGLLLFAIGCVVAAVATDIYWTIVGRVIQGGGAISAAVTALAADLTREEHRTKVMAMIGSSIGLVFAFSLVAAPALYQMIGMAGIFWLTAILAIAAVFLVTHVVASPPLPAQALAKVPFKSVLADTQLLRLNYGIFTLHLAQVIMFLLIPRELIAYGLPLASHWKVYLPAVLVAFVLMVPAIIRAERHGKMKQTFIGAISLLLITEILFWLGAGQFWIIAAALVIFFVAFNILEATLPSLISRIAPPSAKGAALGVYNTSQALGVSLGGAIGGFLARHFSYGAVFAAALIPVIGWVILASGMKVPAPRKQVAA